MVYYVIAYYTFAKGDPSVMAKQSRKKRSPGRRILLLLLLVLLAAGFFRWSNHSLQVERFTFTSPRLPQGFAGCTIVELSDLHGAQFGEGNQDLIDEIRELSPDYIFLTGDLLDRFRETPHSYAVDLGSALAAIAPTYFVTGNHEWALPHVPDLKEGLEAAGVTVLDNRFVTLERGGDSIILAGIDDPNGYADQNPGGAGRRGESRSGGPLLDSPGPPQRPLSPAVQPPGRGPGDLRPWPRRYDPPALYRWPHQYRPHPFPLLHRRLLHGK